MKNIEGKNFTIKGREYIITCDARKSEDSLGFGIVLFNKVTDTSGEDYSLSGCYFMDEKPYFSERVYNLDH